MAATFQQMRRRKADQNQDEIAEIKQELGEHRFMLDRFDTALFATDTENENGQRGLMVIGKRLDAFMDIACLTWKVLKGIAATVVAGLASLGAVGKAFGWW